MTAPRLDRFLDESVIRTDAADEGLTPDEIYGLYVSWCSLSGTTPVSGRLFRAALATHSIHPHRQGHRSMYQGLSMTGPAATDYILSSIPDPADGAPVDGAV